MPGIQFLLSEVHGAVEICDTITFDNIFVLARETLNLQLRDNATVYFRETTTFGYAKWEGILVAINATNTIQGEDGICWFFQGTGVKAGHNTDGVVEQIFWWTILYVISHGLSVSVDQASSEESFELKSLVNATFSNSILMGNKNAIQVKNVPQRTEWAENLIIGSYSLTI
ncbi:hypothetical protein HUJ04_010406 [Dendroctonus ponderosae]|nr:hypothetical protein HUJ04_010406 [Dendroctonus ponderosae]